MKKIYFILLLLLAPVISQAQSSKTKKADTHYDRLEYSKAIEAYTSLLKKGDNSLHVYQRLANSYYFINDTKQAETFYARIIDRKNIDPESVYNYAQSLKANGKTAESNTYMKRFAELKPDDSRARAFMKDPDYLPKIIDEDSREYRADNLNSINSEFSDFGGRIFNNEFYFTSARNTSGKTYNWNNEPFLDLYKARISEGTIGKAEPVKGDINTKYHESTVAISPDGKRMYFDRNDFLDGKYKRGSDGVNQLKIFYAENIEGRWTNIQPVSFNMDDYSTGHPALSPDGKTLYFTSDRPGGKGQADVYKVSINSDGSFGIPENLGDKINTEGREGFPFIDKNGTLYFSSDGHPGMGGLDVYAAPAKGNSFETPVNMGLGINSPDDDFAFYYNPETDEGYVSSNRPGGKGSDDIYKVERIERCDWIANITVIDANTNSALSDVQLVLFDKRDNRLKSKNSDSRGESAFSLACNQEHVIQAHKSGYESAAETVPSQKSGERHIEISLKPIDDIVEGDRVKLNPIFFEFDKYNITPKAAFELDKLVELMKKNTEIKVKVEAHTDNRGSDSYNQILSERRAKSTVEYVISKGIDRNRISGEGFGEKRPLHNCATNCTDKQHDENRRSEFIIVK